jgi:hypothetical protein
MSRRMEVVLRFSAVVFLCLLPGRVSASDPPDSAVNPRNRTIETIDSHWADSKYVVRHAIRPGLGQSAVASAVSGALDGDPEPRLAIGSNGDTWVTWRESVPSGRVLIRRREFATGAWSTQAQVSASGEAAMHPRIAYDGTTPWVAYLTPTALGTAIQTVRIVTDSPDPFGALLVALSSYTGDLDVQIQSESGHLWVTWIDSSTMVGWSEYDYETDTWTSPNYESYENDSVDATRGRIAAIVLGE